MKIGDLVRDWNREFMGLIIAPAPARWRPLPHNRNRWEVMWFGNRAGRPPTTYEPETVLEILNEGR
jgi:hypothetical protein